MTADSLAHAIDAYYHADLGLSLFVGSSHGCCSAQPSVHADVMTTPILAIAHTYDELAYIKE